MASSSVHSVSAALVSYDPTLPHICIEGRLNTVVQEVFRRSLDAAKMESRLLSSLAPKWKERIVTGVALGVKHLYIDKELGKKMACILKQNLRVGKYEDYRDPFAFKDALFRDLKSVCPDKHLGLVFYEPPIPDYDPDRSLRTLLPEEWTTQQRNYMEPPNGDRPDFSKEVTACIIPGTNIGYFKINLFPSPELPETRPIIDHAMKNIVNADSLIIDLRENNGGYPATVAFVASYLFGERQLLNQLYQRSANKLTSYYAEPEKLDQVFGGRKLIYVLTSEKTFSGGEELAYDLQTSKRAKIIGQPTAGGAHPVRSFVVDDHTFVVVPFEKAINPHTGTNWEGTGVIPDYLIANGEDTLAFTRALIEQ